jgi:hypothetical protein
MVAGGESSVRTPEKGTLAQQLGAKVQVLSGAHGAAVSASRNHA